MKTPERTIKPHVSPIHLSPGKEHTVAIDFVNYIPRFPPNLIEAEAATYPLYPLLAGAGFMPNLNYYEASGIYQTVSITVCFVLSLLFWLLAFQNPKENNLRLIALRPTCFGISALLGYIQVNSKFSFRCSEFVQRFNGFADTVNPIKDFYKQITP